MGGARLASGGGAIPGVCRPPLATRRYFVVPGGRFWCRVDAKTWKNFARA